MAETRLVVEHPRRTAVLRALRVSRRFLTPGWFAVHTVVLAAVVAMALLGRWQLDVSNRKHFDLQNFGYVLQWWTFAGFAIWFWLRTMRDSRRAPATPVGSTELALRGPDTGIARVGPTDFMSSVEGDGSARIAYRGYVMPDSGTRPVASHGDAYHDSYNDYLWRLGMAGRAPDQPSGLIGQVPRAAADGLEGPALAAEVPVVGNVDSGPAAAAVVVELDCDGTA